MFTGIIQKTSTVISLVPTKGGAVLAVKKPSGWKVEKGDSISINGVCSTVKKVGRDMQFEYMPETLARANIGSLGKGETVNLEQSLTLRDRLDGHLVLGHVDEVGKVVRMQPEGNSTVFAISVSPAHARLVAEKGSVCIDGISLTVVDAGAKTFTVKIIPYTIEHTSLRGKRVGDTVNVEFDVLAKYIDRRLADTSARSL